jgi:hypothetical protein
MNKTTLVSLCLEEGLVFGLTNKGGGLGFVFLYRKLKI